MDIIRKEITEKMSRIVIHNNTVYLCGQVGDKDVPCIVEQTKCMLDKVDKLLESANSHKDKILSATIYLKDMKDFNTMNKVWNAWLTPGCAPARACVQAAMSDEEYLVEISVIAAV
ncbi:MAG: RidA family protein [Lentisphaerae bacterium]|nr:RidA family protein [Lentisphaerota bacterium]MCP4102276.1 RidA family protein [Lentisphaerota bacterium]